MSVLFSAIEGANPEFSLDEKKEAFFFLIRELLKEKRIKSCPPEELWCEGHDVWDAEDDVIVFYLSSKWPGHIKSENDMALNDYFYDIPAILWVAPDGSLIGS